MNVNTSSRWQQPHCQCCLGVESLENITTDSAYEDMLWDVFNIFIIADVRGKQICRSCVQRLHDAANFKTLVLSSQNTLQSAVSTFPQQPPALSCKVVKDENKSKIKREVTTASSSDEDDDDDAGNTFEFDVPMACTRKIKTEALNPQVSIEVERLPDAGSSDLYTGPMSKKRKRPIKHPEYEDLKSATIALASNSNMTLFRWSKMHVYKCLFCEDTFPEITLLKEHTIMHRDHLVSRIRSSPTNEFIRAEVTHLKCTQCHNEVSDVKELMQHLETTHRVPFKIRDSLIIPFKLDELACVECGQKFETFAQLDRHMNRHYHRSVCEKCGKHLRSNSELYAHLSTHTSTVVKCKLCDESFDSYYNRQKHYKEKHGAASGRGCPECNEMFASLYDRKRHMIREHGYKKSEFKCELCGRVYEHRFQLKNHVSKVHLHETKFACDVCDSGFMRKCELMRHMKYHSDNRPFQCGYCKKDFVTQHHLNRHMAAHDESYKHICPHCGGSYTQKSYLNTHMQKCAGNRRSKLVDIEMTLAS